MQFVTTKAAAERLNIGERHIRWLLAAGHLRGQRVGRDWVVDEAGLENFILPAVRRRRKSNSRKRLAVVKNLRK